jgi:hypothetical protein
MCDRPISHFTTQGACMRLLRFSARLLGAAVFFAVASCSDSTAPDPESRAATDLRLLAAPYGTPALATTQVSFYAVKGQSAAVDIWYHRKAGAVDSTKFLEFRMGPASLERHPDGSTISPGDSVFITLNVTDPRHFIVEFQPTGLTFAAADQPTLKLIYAACGADLNYDGKVDSLDAAIEQQLSIWRQETPFQPWYKLSSVVAKDFKEVNAKLTGFTGYAIEY